MQHGGMIQKLYLVDARAWPGTTASIDSGVEVRYDRMV